MSRLSLFFVLLLTGCSLTQTTPQPPPPVQAQAQEITRAHPELLKPGHQRLRSQDWRPWRAYARWSAKRSCRAAGIQRRCFMGRQLTPVARSSKR